MFKEEVCGRNCLDSLTGMGYRQVCGMDPGPPRQWFSNFSVRETQSPGGFAKPQVWAPLPGDSESVFGVGSVNLHP